MKTYIRTVVLSLVVGLVALSAPASATTSRTTNHNSLLAAKIRQELVALPTTAFSTTFLSRWMVPRLPLVGRSGGRT